MNTNRTATRKPRTWIVTGRTFPGSEEVTVSGRFTNKDVAREVAQNSANRLGTPQRVSTKGSFGSFTVEPAR